MSCPVTITCGSPPDGSRGVAYSHTFPTTGGPNLFFTISAGALPPGLTLDPATGVVSGTPSAAGTFAFTVKIIDAQIIATGDDGSFSDSKIVITSDNGNTWARATTAITDSGYSIVYSDALGLWVNGADFAGTTEQVQTSPDGASGNWTAQTSPADASAWVRDMAAGPDKVVAIYRKSSVFRVMTTPDGAAWTQQTLPSGVTILGTPSIAYSSDLNRYCIVPCSDGGGHSGVLTSTDGVTWAFHAMPEDLPAAAIAWGAGLFVVVGGPQGSGDHLMTSPDGFMWTVRANPGGSAQSLVGVHFANGIFVAVSGDPGTTPTHQAVTSTNGLSWTLRATPAVRQWQVITFGYGFWISGDNSAPSSQPLMKSTDNGVTWALVPALGFNFGYVTGIDFGPLDNCSDTANCSITIGGVTAGNRWRGMVQCPGNSI